MYTFYCIYFKKEKKGQGERVRGTKLKNTLSTHFEKLEKDPQICNYNTKYNEESKRNKFHEHLCFKIMALNVHLRFKF